MNAYFINNLLAANENLSRIDWTALDYIQEPVDGTN